jgi:hypothetical protein
VLYRSAWYKSKVEQGVLERDDARRRIISVSENISLKSLSSEAKKNEMGAQLPVIGRTTDGFVILGLKDFADHDAAFFGEIDLKTSVRLTNEILAKQITTQGEAKKSFEEVNFQIQTKSGRARNLYGKEQNILQLSAFSAAESARIFGLYDPIDVETVRSQYAQIAQYPVKVGENPGSARLYFVPLQPEQTAQVNRQSLGPCKTQNWPERRKKSRRRPTPADGCASASLLPLPSDGRRR